MRALPSVETQSRLEPVSLARDDGKRHDGLSLNSRCLITNFTCPDTLAQIHLNAAVTGPGVVADEAEEKQKRKYSCSSPTYYFVPIAVETMGAVGAEASDFLHQLDHASPL